MQVQFMVNHKNAYFIDVEKRERICSRYKRLENKAICTIRNKINEVENFGQILHIKK